MFNFNWQELEQRVIAYRRDFHKFPETAWTEFRTASLVAENLYRLGYNLKLGKEIIDEGARMGVPSAEKLAQNYQRALKQGAVKEFAKQMQGGFTGVVAEIENGLGPVLAFRFDLDALSIKESNASTHQPEKLGFASFNAGKMHACGHDGHTALGLGLAEFLSVHKSELQGKIKLIFQPAEEGVRGAKAMVAAGVTADIDYLFGLHLGTGTKSGELYPGVSGFLATSKFDVSFQGQAAHAGNHPEMGKNCLLAAASAALNLQAISRHGDGVTRINVGYLEAGSGRNIIPDQADLMIETRGGTTDLNQYMYQKALTILENTAQMYELKMTTTLVGGAVSAQSDFELVDLVRKLAVQTKEFDLVHDSSYQSGGSEDFTYLLKDVQSRGGKGCYIGLGSQLAAANHTPEFDFNEADLLSGIKLLARLSFALSGN